MTGFSKKKFFGILVIVYIFCFLFISPSLSQGWKEVSGEHFIVYFLDNEGFANDVLRNAEIFYRQIAIEIGYPRYSEFWTWDKRVKIYIYQDRDTFIKATSQPAWSEGMADYTNKQILSYAWSQGFMESLLPHEMAHLIFRDFVGFKGEIPLWLDEGVAQWAEEPKRAYVKTMAKKLYQGDQLITLDDMMKLKLDNFKEKDRVYIRPNRTKDGSEGVLFISGDNFISTYYLQSVSLVGFLIERYGSDSFANLCRQLRDGKSLDEALRFTYPVQIRSLSELENAWRKHLAE